MKHAHEKAVCRIAGNERGQAQRIAHSDMDVALERRRKLQARLATAQETTCLVRRRAAVIEIQAELFDLNQSIAKMERFCRSVGARA